MEIKRPFDPRSLPDFAEWAAWHSSEVDFPTYLEDHGGWELAVAFADLFWPEFVEVDGFVLRAHAYSSEKLAHWRRDPRLERRDIELVINHLHLGDLFLNAPWHPAYEPLVPYFARILAGTWAAALAQRFPDRQFEFVLDPGPGGDNWVEEISFCQAP
jgi:hypothetical protein